MCVRVCVCVCVRMCVSYRARSPSLGGRRAQTRVPALIRRSQHGRTRTAGVSRRILQVGMYSAHTYTHARARAHTDTILPGVALPACTLSCLCPPALSCPDL